MMGGCHNKWAYKSVVINITDFQVRNRFAVGFIVLPDKRIFLQKV